MRKRNIFTHRGKLESTKEKKLINIIDKNIVTFIVLIKLSCMHLNFLLK